MKFLYAVLLSFIVPLSAKNQKNPYDPGLCTDVKRGKFLTIKDRNDDDKILVCVQQQGKYQWTMINGQTYGNYFDPAKDCSHVVDNIPEAKDGVYWIRTDKGPIKAWCDVHTDGGGFMLIGVNHSPSSWSVPSNTTLVHPKSKAQWSSAFGGLNVRDFRIQVSTSKNFEDTQTHWYYRFHSPRTLSSLFLCDKGGCDRLSPGIGDVAFVKDLKVGKVVTRNFKCSRFGAFTSPVLGWGKMNRCFTRSCPEGFAYIYTVQYDHSGSYSYSVRSRSSGIQDKSTAFLGCDQSECCACFGPDTKQDYCAPRCKAINGGTVLKEKDKITVWFWIRSSSPNRVWKKCMEFKEMNGARKNETWHVEEKGGVLKKGPCSFLGDVKLNDGVAVVRDSQALHELPNIEGLLSYRIDDKQIYLREKSKWQALGKEEELNKLKDNITQQGRDLSKQERDLRKQERDLRKQEQDLRKQGRDLKKQEQELTKQGRDLRKQEQDFTKQGRDLRKIEQDLSKQGSDLRKQERDFTKQGTDLRKEIKDLNKDLELQQQVSCKAILDRNSAASDGVYKIKTQNGGFADVYCHMRSLTGCPGGGWTMVMKIDGDYGTFNYESSYWTNKQSYNSYGGRSGFDFRETKLPTYWSTSFKQICIGMKVGTDLNFVSIWQSAYSLYDLIADGNYRETHVGRSGWKSLIAGSSLQRNCNKEGFNAHQSSTYARVRVGILGNEQSDCFSPDSFLGIGANGPSSVCTGSLSDASAGNAAACTPDNGTKKIKAMAYIMVR